MRGQGSGGGTLGDPFLDLRSAANGLLASDDDSGGNFAAFIPVPAGGHEHLLPPGQRRLHRRPEPTRSPSGWALATRRATSSPGRRSRTRSTPAAATTPSTAGPATTRWRGERQRHRARRRRQRHAQRQRRRRGPTHVYGGNGNDYIYAWLGTPESIVGGAGIDTLDTTAYTGNYLVNLATGLTTFAGECFTQMENLFSGAGHDTLTGTAAANLINGGAGNDTIDGGAGNDSLAAGNGNDILRGGDGNDTLNGGGAPARRGDSAFGGAGNDYIYAVLGTPESIDGGAGIDTLDTTSFSGNYVVNLATGLTNYAGSAPPRWRT